jgi:hypothetical protein
MLDVLFWIVISLVLLIVLPDRWDARRKIAKRQAPRATGAYRKALGARRITPSK